MRSRNLKPGYFTNEHLAECQPLARILFAGLWCVADREGRLEDRPRRLKTTLLPYDDCNVDNLLNELAENGFIVRYVVGRCRLIQITNFRKHQHPHVKEPASVLPVPDKHQTNTGQDRSQPGGFPLTDSLLLIPDSLVPVSPEDAHARATSNVDNSLLRAAETIASASFVADDLDDIQAAVSRSLDLTPRYDRTSVAKDAELFVRWKGYRRKPPDDWYRAWLNWLDRAARQQPAATVDEPYPDKIRRWKTAQGLT